MDGTEKPDWIGREYRPLSYPRDIHKVEGTPFVQKSVVQLIKESKSPLEHDHIWQRSYTAHNAGMEPCKYGVR
jgi:hypothetical protein